MCSGQIWSRPAVLARGGAGGGRGPAFRRSPAAAPLIALAVGCGLVLVGCASTAGTGARRGAAHEFAGLSMPAAPGASAPLRTAPSTLTPLLTANRMLVRTASLTVRVRDVRAAANRAAALATSGGGYLESEQVGSPEPFPPGPLPFAQSSRGSAGRWPSASVTIRVPSARFQATISTLAAIGTLVTESVQTQDVTQQVVNVTSRVASAESAVARLRTLFARAKTVDAVLAVQSALASQEASLESLQAQAAVLARQTQLTTVTATFLAAAGPVHRARPAGFMSGLRAGWHALTVTGQGFLVAVGFALPWALLLGALAGLAWWGWRRRPVRRDRSEPPAPAEPGPATPG